MYWFINLELFVNEGKLFSKKRECIYIGVKYFYFSFLNRFR
jgi:hypothetical protein